MRSKSILLTGILLACAASAQEGAPPMPPAPGAPEAGNPQQEMMELFRKIELRLREIDDHLYDASAGERPAASEEESGIGDLIRSSVEKSEENLTDIDRILEIAQQSGGT